MFILVILGLLASIGRAATTMTLARYRLGADTSWISIRPVSRAAVQAALDRATPSRHLDLSLGAGNLEADSTIWVHGNTSIQGAGRGITTITRARFSADDPVGAGNVLATAAYGRHALNNSLVHGLPVDSLEAIDVAGITIDGQCGRWPSVNPNGPQNFGINLFYVDRPALRDVEVKNTLQTGVQFYGCRDGSMRGIWVRDTGQEVMLGTRNGINLNDHPRSHLPKRWGERFTLSDIHIRNQKDTAFGFASVSHVSVDHVWIECDHDTTYGNYAFEFEGHIPGYTMKDFTIADVQATGLANQFMTNGIHECDGLENVVFDHCVSVFSSKAHRGGAFNLKGSRPNHLFDFEIRNSTFSNINSSNGDGRRASAAMVYCYNDGYQDCRGLRIRHCRFEGASGGSHHPENPGIKLGGRFADVELDSVVVVGAEAEGFWINAGSDTLRNVTLDSCVVEGAQGAAFRIMALKRGADVDGIRLRSSTFQDTNRSGPGHVIEVVADAGGMVRNVDLGDVAQVPGPAGRNMGGFEVIETHGGKVVNLNPPRMKK